MTKKITTAIMIALVHIGCSQSIKNEEDKSGLNEHENSMSSKSNPDFKNLVFDSEKDLICGMPLKAGISDTAIYKGKVFGFCAKECKEEFLKSPEAYTKQQ